MGDALKMRETASCELVRAAAADFSPQDLLNPKGRFVVEHWRDGEKIGEYDMPNTIVNEGKNSLLDVMFHAATQITTWYLGLVNTGATIVVGDTYAQINGTNGWDEFTDYDEATRQEWTEGASSSQTITNATPIVFTISATGTVYGLFLVGGGTDPEVKDDAAGGGVLWAAAAFASGEVAVLDNDQLKVTYTVSA